MTSALDEPRVGPDALRTEFAFELPRGSSSADVMPVRSLRA